MQKVVLVGAGGKMGMRLTRNLRNSEYDVSYLEVNSDGIKRLEQMDLHTSNEDTVVPPADIVILAVPDVILGKVSKQIVPKMKAGAMVYTLDPACALAGQLFFRENLSYFIAHPSHPSVFNWEPTEAAQRDFFGGNLAKQAVVCALYKGPESEYPKGEHLAKIMYAPVYKAFRITAEQMGLLEPALVETLCSTLQVAVKEGLDIVIKKGVPAEAARAFLLGHLNIQLAVIYQELPGAVFSDAANKAITRAKPLLLKETWRRVFEPEDIKVQIQDITT
ncbi:semialdehyde dehydrogenase [candidate division KSB1 bacterium]|nr:semialdehyde dehydrogenase [candidate division KSB1 bacterium]